MVRNVLILDAGLLERINAEIVRLGHAAAGCPPEAVLKGRVDSYVVETDVEHPTDLRLLWDALRTAMKRLARLCRRLGFPGWRQVKHLLRAVEWAFRRVSRMRKTNRSHANAVEDCLAVAGRMISKLEGGLDRVRAMPEAGEIAFPPEIERFFGCALILADQVERRLLRGKAIPHDENIFLVFEPHTRWISKGKVGAPVELGVPVCVMEDQHQFILGHEIMCKGGDIVVIGLFLDRMQETWPSLRALSLDRGFWSPEVYDDLSGKLDLAALPKKGKPTAEESRRQKAPDFAEANLVRLDKLHRAAMMKALRKRLLAA